MNKMRKSGIALTLSLALLAPFAWADSHKGKEEGHKGKSHKAKVESARQAEQAAVYLDQIEQNALDARRHAGQLRSYTRIPSLHSWQMHTYELNLIRESANDMAEVMGEFADVKKGATKLQNKAFNIIVTHADTLEEATEEAITIANRDKDKLHVAHPQYEAQVDKIYNAADHIVEAANMAETWKQLQKTRKKLEKLEEKAAPGA